MSFTQALRYSSSRHTVLSIRSASNLAKPFSSIHARRFSSSSTVSSGNKPQSVSALAPIGVEGALSTRASLPTSTPRKIFSEFALPDRVGIVSGGGRGLGLEMAMALCEAGARAVYCLDIHEKPTEEWEAVKEYVGRLERLEQNPSSHPSSRLEYVKVNVTDQKAVWKCVEEIGDREGRMDVCIAAAGVLKPEQDVLEYPGEEFSEVMNINVNGVLFTAQAAGQQMRRFGNKGSIILIASMSGSITNHGHAWIAYNTSKSAVLQMTRSMACELGGEGIRVNSLSPGHIYTKMTAQYLEPQPHLFTKWSSLNPLGRLGRADEMRGVVVWLASDASTFCTGSDILVSGGHHAW
ncbi:NAD-binding protein [Lentinula aciculospora]|uniref:NAD-binding protein n=1 Tax=Lentinula aciculospora TaxID=153920 RepID=A0A9W9DRB7_9AGAR|nr:NAD-binding protein [Lentinula aciculospora]